MYEFLAGTPLADAWHFARGQSRADHASDSSVPAIIDQEKSLAAVRVRVIDDTLRSDPKQWPWSKKLRVVAIISFYTFAVYAGSAIYITAVPGVMRSYLLFEQSALLGLSLYVLGYGTGPLIWAPLSEVAWIGRNPVYCITAFAFLVVSIITATAQSWPAFLVMRFIQGFFGSPCLANGGASLHDIFEGRYLPMAMSIWVAFAYAGPAIGPLMASYLVKGSGWRISMWEIVAGAAISFATLLFLPETYQPKVVHESKKLSLAAGYPVCSDEEDSTQPGVLATLREALVKPCQISIQDPAITYVNLYTSYLYSCYYTFFDGFPLVYTFVYRWVPSHIGLSFLPIIVGCGVASLIYSIYVMRRTSPQETNPEARLLPALVAVWAPPIGIFVFGWTSHAHAHWAYGMLGVVIYAAGVFIILQCIIMYILDSYPRYAASLFAANDFCRSALAAGAVHFGLPLYRNLGPGKACTILGSISILGIGGMFVLYWKGKELRARSKFTG